MMCQMAIEVIFNLYWVIALASASMQWSVGRGVSLHRLVDGGGFLFPCCSDQNQGETLEESNGMERRSAVICTCGRDASLSFTLTGNYQKTVLYTGLKTVYDSRLHQNKTN